MRKVHVLALLAPVLIVGALSACGGDDTAAEPEGEIEILDPWARLAREGLGAAYFTIRNGTDQTVRLTGASSPSAESVEIHETTMQADGTMSMVEVPEGFEIPAGGELELTQGGKHLMLIGFDPGTADSIELSLDFDGTTVNVVARIDRDASAMPMDHDHSMPMDSMPMDSMPMEMPATTMAEASAEEGSLDELLEGVEWQDGDLESILAALDIEALHALDVDLNDGMFDAEVQLPVARRALAVVQMAKWPIDVDPSALEQALVELVDSLQSGDVAAAAAAAAVVHDVSHDLEPAHSH
jgi:copper(I)-binding protein